MIDVYCDKCGSKIKHMITLKPIKDILRATKNKCSSCGIGLNPQDFTIELEKFWIGCLLSCVAEKNRQTTAGQIVINLFIFIITEILVYQKTFSPSRFTIGSKNFLGYTENNGAHSLDSKENDIEGVYLSSLEIGVFLDDLPSHYSADLGRATCHSIKEGFAKKANLMTICQLVISDDEFRREFHQFLKLKWLKWFQCVSD